MKWIAIVVLFFCTAPIVSAQNPDIDALQAIHTHRNKSLDGMFTVFSRSASIVSMAAPTAVFASGFILKERPLMRKGLYVAGSMAINVGATYALKFAVDRERPYKTYPDFISPYQLENSAAMPSGHASNAFATATALTFAFPKWYTAVAAYSWATTVAYSRLHLGVHYPSDVIVGAAVGAGSAWLAHVINKRVFRRN